MSREMKIRPSELIGLDSDPLTVFCFDRAITAYGEALLAELKGIEAKTKKEAQTKTKKILARWLRTPGDRRAGQSSRRR
jgi:hypothetical protein